MKPKYLIVIDAIEDIIRSSEIDQMIPSERVLSEKLNISRMTVRKAIDILVNQGKLYRINQVGTFVGDQKLYKVFNTLSSFTEEVLASGSKPSNKILAFNIIKAPKDLSMKLNISEGSFVYQVIRVRKRDQDPLHIDESYFPCDLIPLNEAIVQGSIYQYIQKTLNLGIASSMQHIKAVLLPEHYASELELPVNTPIIYTDNICYLSNGRIFEYTKTYKNQDKYELIIQAMNVRT